MKKRLSILLAVVLVLSMLAACGQTAEPAAPAADGTAAEAPVAEAEKYTLKMHLSIGEHDPVYDAQEHFKELVEEGTNGNVVVELYPSSSLGNTADCLEGLSLRACDIVFDCFANTTPVTDIGNLDAVPYMYNSMEHYLEVWRNTDIGQNILADLEADAGLKVMYGGLSGVRVVTSNVEIHTPEDVVGLKIRVPTTPVYLATWEWLGATPTPLGAGEIFTALQQNTVQAQENPYNSCVSLSLQECCDYVTETNHVYCSNVYVMDQNFFNSLPEEYRTVIEAAAVECAALATDNVIAVADEKRQVFVDAGAQIFETDITAWQTKLEGFVETEFPYLVDYYNTIVAADPAK